MDPDPVPAESPEAASFRRPARFRVHHLLYAMALVSAGLATFGPAGLVLGLLILTVWILVFQSRKPWRTLIGLTLLLLCGGCLFGLLLPTISTAREAARRVSCRGHLKQLSLALYNYYDVHGSFPPACVRDERGRPKHSWRVLILPFLDEQDLYDAYDMREPWNGPNNRKLARRMPAVFACPSHPENREQACTNYFAVTGNETAWPAEQPRIFGEFPDGLSNTILLLEANNNVPWMEPRDLELEAAVDLLAEPPGWQSCPHDLRNFFYIDYLGRNVALADASVQFLYHPLDRSTARQLLQVADGGPLRDSKASANGGPLAGTTPRRNVRRLRWDNCARLAAFVLLTLLPLPWVGRRRNEEPRTAAAVEPPSDAES